MAGTTTAMLTQFKKDLLNGGAHMFAAPVTTNGTTTNTSKVVTGIASTAGLYRGMSAAATGVPAGAIIKSVDSATQVTLSDAATASATVSFTFSPDVFNIVLIKATPTGTYDSTSTKYSDITGNTDEASGTGYTAGGQALATNNGASVTGTTAFTQWSVNPSWAGATISVSAAMIINTAPSCGIVKPGVSTHDFGGVQTVTAGTLTLLQPTNNSTSALLRIA